MSGCCRHGHDIFYLGRCIARCNQDGAVADTRALGAYSYGFSAALLTSGMVAIASAFVVLTLMRLTVQQSSTRSGDHLASTVFNERVD